MHHAPGATDRSSGLSPARAEHGRWRRLRPPLLTAAAVAGATTLLATVSPHTPGQYGTCPSLWLLGVYCPGCGALRATADLAHLDLVSAWSMNPLWVLVVPVLVLAWVAWLLRAWRGRRLDLQVAAWMWAAPLAVVLAYAVLRNVPALAPWLAPGGVLP
ncbi:DUF2752 domain-containing protein [Sanguibacter suarezii]|uniref:DUF2752 domain-containing protein n=1 Tax=Sanguibacter suarezii TaxID=60921 RepID=UPI0009FE30AC|nr:DUF2752 domain-containing protein [Sanguibacter suarezii]